MKVDYPRRSRAKIVEAYFRQASTTDYSGVYKGRYIDFEAKETQQKAIHADENFHQHQIDHMEAVSPARRYLFRSLHFAKLSETYLLPAPALIHYYNIDHGSKSMPLSYIQGTAF